MRPLNAKVKSSKNFLSPDQKWPNFDGFRGLRARWYKNFQFLLQKAHPCPNSPRLSHFTWWSVEGSDPQGSCWKKSWKSQNLPLKWCVTVNIGLHSRAPVMLLLRVAYFTIWLKPLFIYSTILYDFIATVVGGHRIKPINRCGIKITSNVTGPGNTSESL